ncbi:MAG: hypothetical protein QOG49_852, partial [Frankiaceae bacterium]|nr:hypothetical protein [Frankiaceae bacterium]
AGSSSDAGSPSPSPSLSPSPSESSSAAAGSPADADALAAITATGDVVLVDPATGATVRTLVPAGPDGAGTDASIAWDAAHGVVYFTRAGCAVWRHRIADGATEQIAAGRRVAVSPDGSLLAIWTCTPDPGQLTVIDAGTAAAVLAIPLSTQPLSQGGAMEAISDIDWRPDGKAVVVTEGWEGDDLQYLVDLRKPPKAVQRGARVPVKGVNGSFHSVEYVGQRLLMAGTCCPPDEATSISVVRDGKTGNATKLAHLSDIGLIQPSADAKGRLVYLRRESADGPAALWALPALDGVPQSLGGTFAAVDW